MTKVTMPNGKDYTFAAPPFSKNVVRCLELFSKDDKERTGKDNAEMVVHLHAVMLGSLQRGGHTEEEADEAICSIDFGGENMSDQLRPILEAIGIS